MSMHGELAGAAVGKVALQRFLDGAKGNFVPGNFVFREQAGFNGFGSGIELVTQQTGPVKQVDLAHAGHVQQ